MIVPLSRSLILRIVSALVLMPVVVFVVYKGGFLFAGLLIVLFAISLYELFGLARKADGMIVIMFLGVAYITFSLFSAYLVRDHYGFLISVIFLSALWASDIGAYISGKAIGGPKMAPIISPNKTWAGFGGAVLFSFLTVLAFVLLVPNSLGVTSFVLIVASFLIAVTGQGGDLVISMLKRQANAKDSGALIPGHGGLLDRIDSLFLATPVFLLVLEALS